MAEPTLTDQINQLSVRAAKTAQAALADVEDIVERLASGEAPSSQIRLAMQDLSFLLDDTAHLEGLRAAKATIVKPRQSEKIVHLQQIGSTLAVCQSEEEGEEATADPGRVTCPECKAAYERSGY